MAKRNASKTLVTKDFEPLAERLHALSAPSRLHILYVLGQANAPMTIIDITAKMDLTQPTVSHHVQDLVRAGLVEKAKRGSWSYISLLPDGLAALGASVGQLGDRRPA